jgi:hypothetical protein
MATKASKMPVSEYFRECLYCLMLDNNKPIGLCMIVSGKDEHIGDTKVIAGKKIHSNSLFSIFVKEEHRGKGYANEMAGGLAERESKTLLIDGCAAFDNEFIAADKRGVYFARKYFSSAFLCFGFPPYRAVDNLSRTLLGQKVTSPDIDACSKIEDEFKRQAENYQKALFGKI